MERLQEVLQGDCRDLLKTLPDNSCDCCVTSPPYYKQRNYGAAGQMGLEENEQLYIAGLVEVFREVRRVLKDDGTLWLNIADSYAKKRLLCIPWRLALALQEDGWILRQDIIWNKPNAMPENAKDRCTRSHEYIFLFSKSKRYYFDYEAIKEPCGKKGNARSFRGGGVYTNKRSFDNTAAAERESHGNTANKSGKRLKRDVWSVATKGFAGAHLSTFPEKLVEPCILAGARPGGVVIDPFLGSGTTAVVAKRNGRGCIGVEIDPENVVISKNRIQEVGL